MEIISHRGYWKNVSEKNMPIAFTRSFELGFGTETDLRDFDGDIVISHDIPDKDSISLRTFFESYKQTDNSTTLALNVKSDGLQKKLKLYLNYFEIKNYFVFDMSIPDTIAYKEHDINFFSRQSEFESLPVFYENCKGVWLDAFDGIWYDKELILEHLKNDKKVAIVSPELHKRDMYEFWEMLRNTQINLLSGVILCTDFPEEAKNYFN
ncbi:PI-PLC domain-containing protein [Aquirufa lenticrescens]|uniref:hypothetical protein n=1 Tax=Aquirufa lenticrescens TaxID=2696560 RepID=UPI001CAA4B7A|nr:hypothetical protein [Aquirufa lenticrescens]UAJ14210.1 hypothetical protein G9X62_06390 [Aquirufa lenticrescens]